MSKEKLVTLQNVYFVNEKLPMILMAKSERYGVVSRRLHRREDASLLHFEVERGSCETFTEAYNQNKNNPVYSLLDFEKGVKSSDNRILGNYDYGKQSDCKKAIKELEDGTMELSHRSVADLNIDWTKTLIG